MIDENLCRADLTPAQAAQQTARRKVLYEILHPEVAYEARPGRAGNCRQIGDNSEPADRFTADTAARTGRPERSIQRDAERGRKLGADLSRVAGTSLDKGVELDALARMKPEELFRASAVSLSRAV